MKKKDSEPKKKAQTKRGKKRVVKKISHLVKPEGMKLEDWQVLLRRQAAQDEKFGIKCVDEKLCPGEYIVSNPKTWSQYKVVYRGANSPWNYCSCMDFKTSQLGTCKHIEALKSWFSGRHKVQRTIPPYTSVYLSYRHERKVCIRIGSDNADEYKALASRYFDEDGVLLEKSYDKFGKFLKQAKAIDDNFRCYNDAVSFILAAIDRKQREKIIAGYDDKKLDSLLSVPLYQYQREGVRFAFKAGKSIIADEMGLGKTIQAIAAAELLRHEGLIGSVLVVCPTSLKYQWKREIEKFTGGKANVRVIEGDHLKRRQQYESTETYKIISYNSLCNDIKILGGITTEMLVMDEVQRLKNWKTQVSMACRRIESQYAVVLSGTPLENKLDELFSIVEFVDQYALSPYYKFRDDHIVTEETGYIIGYKNLNDISRKLSNVLIRRKKKDVRLQMPKRTDSTIFVAMTKEQKDIHDDFKNILARILNKWRKYHFLSEQERQRLLLTLCKMRMVCDSTYILDEKTRFDTKIDELVQILNSILSSHNEKVVVFSQWERMTRLVAKELEKMGVGYCNLNGGVPSEKRGEMVNEFADNPSVRVFVSTDAGSTGLNLQAASTIINLDLPWNPAVLEQRIARIYRIGQQSNIQVINLVSPSSIEEEMIAKLRFKSSMFAGALDEGDDTVFITDDKFKKIAELVDNLLYENDNVDGNVNVETVSDTEPKVEDPMPEPTVEEPIPNPTVEERVQGEQGDDVVSTGIKFLTGLASALKTEEGKAQLMNRLVKTDENTGETSISIKVPDKNVVKQLLDVVGKLLG